MSDVLAINHLRSGRKQGWKIPPNIERVHIARSKPTAPPPVEPKPAPAARIAKAPAPMWRLIRDYGEIVDACRDMAEKLNISRAEIDRLCGFPDGHTGHMLSKNCSKLIGPLFLLCLLEVLGLRLLVVEDAALTAKTLARRIPRHEEHVRRQRELPAPSDAA
jgi:hypothetical protein